MATNDSKCASTSSLGTYSAISTYSGETDDSDWTVVQTAEGKEGEDDAKYGQSTMFAGSNIIHAPITLRRKLPDPPPPPRGSRVKKKDGAKGMATIGQSSGSNVDLVDAENVQTLHRNYSRYAKWGKGLESKASLERDGSISISLNLKKKLPDLPKNYAQEVEEFGVDQSPPNPRDVPTMSIVIMIVGSRGDVQPYVALGRRLAQHGHRIRIASHETFRLFVEGQGLEFFDIGGDPRELMSYMVKNPGLMPAFESMTNGDVGKKRKMLAEIMDGCWRSCYAPCPIRGRTFAADAIISNPPAFAHIHCAEALGIPLLLTFTMPWSPTTEFHHPLVNVKESNAKKGMTNYLSYALADILTWQGIGDLVNTFRSDVLKLKTLSMRTGPGLVDTLKVPWTYCMSPALVPKPLDWKNHIADVVGFYYLDLATSYTPPDDLTDFLAAGDPPIYIGFGSVVVDDAAVMTETVFEATRRAGVRALVSAGWGGLGGVSIPSHVFILGNIPHDWLFDQGRVAAVVHHGGAGTTAAGLSKGRPTVVVPFFGDQAFWGNMIHRAGAGPAPIHHKDLNADNLCAAITYAISPEAKTAAAQMAEQIRSEDGVGAGVDSFYRHLPLKYMRCDLDPTRLAVWWSTEHCLRLSGFAAQTLADAGKLDMATLDLHRSKEYTLTKTLVTDPISGSATAIFWTLTHLYEGIVQSIVSPRQGIIKTGAAIPGGVVDIVSSIYKGFHGLPELYGAELRPEPEVTGLTSGLKEAGKGFYYGLVDGVASLWREPLRGARKEGFVGALKGSARGLGNVTLLPSAGLVGLVKHPMKGALRSIQSLTTSKEKDHVQYRTRMVAARKAADAGTALERHIVLQNFEEAETKKRSRRQIYGKLASEYMFAEQRLPRPSSQISPTASSVSTLSPPSSPSTPTSTSPVSLPPSRAYDNHPLPPIPSEGKRTKKKSDLDEVFEREFTLAIEQSLAEGQKQSAMCYEDENGQLVRIDDDDLDEMLQRDIDFAVGLSLADQERHNVTWADLHGESSTSGATSSSAMGGADDDIQRDIDLAIRLSLEEQQQQQSELWSLYRRS
ncbi:hypothetical protein AAF712_003586 [Marasmius tenuissimus]|uniref:Glycosyltransferase family 28 N-terminal domain-containing protein n=1 Tax=Marasmius tenuissimus TaxID=585030 RepID=A0ABR3A6E6_9AGAR